MLTQNHANQPASELKVLGADCKVIRTPKRTIMQRTGNHTNDTGFFYTVAYCKESKTSLFVGCDIISKNIIAFEYLPKDFPLGVMARQLLGSIGSDL